jgi:chemotaxis protein CheZ
LASLPASEESSTQAIAEASPIAESPVVAIATVAAGKDVAEGDGTHTHIGHLTRQLHNTLRELGYEKSLEHAVGKMPDARDRLNYISTLTEQAAEKTLNAVEVIKPLQEKLESSSASLSSRWQQLLDNKLDVESFKGLVQETRSYLMDVPLQTKATNAQLMDIVMAQDFQDLTGQVIKKLADIVQQLENQLLLILIESIPPEKRKELDNSLLNGPVVNADGRTDIVTTQAQVDDLLDSLGF